jgi:hypothetical protein
MVETAAATHPRSSFVRFFFYSGIMLQWQSHRGKRHFVAICFTKLCPKIYLLHAEEYGQILLRYTTPGSSNISLVVFHSISRSDTLGTFMKVHHVR